MKCFYSEVDGCFWLDQEALDALRADPNVISSIRSDFNLPAGIPMRLATPEQLELFEKIAKDATFYLPFDPIHGTMGSEKEKNNVTAPVI